MNLRMTHFVEYHFFSYQMKTMLGDVMFEADPTIEYLNSESFPYMLLTTWFRGDQYVNFSAGVHFSSAVFEKPITVAVKLAPNFLPIHKSIRKTV